MMITKSLKVRLYPNSSQTRWLNQMLPVTCLVYNLCIHCNMKQLEKGKKIFSISEMFSLVPAFKKKYPVLETIPDSVLSSNIIYACKESETVYKRDGILPDIEKRSEHYKMLFSKSILHKDRKTIAILNGPEIKFKHSLSGVADVNSFVVYKKFDKWYALFTYRVDVSGGSVTPNKFVGIDMGLKEFAILSSGLKIPNPKYYAKLEDKLAAEQRRLSRKNKQSNNWKKQLSSVQRIHEQIYHYRMNFLHKLSNMLVDSYDVIGIEKLHIQSMIEERKYSKSILDAGWATFLKMLKYKAKEKGKFVIEVERFFPSSQLCSKCGSKQLMPVHLRTFECNHCHARIDRDYNASKNIENRARVLYQNRYTR